MTTFYALLSVFVSAMVVENLVFARAMGMDGILERTRKYKLIAWSGGLVAVLSVLGVSLSWGATQLMEELPNWKLLRYPVILLCLSLSYLAVWLLLNKLVTSARARPTDSMIVSTAYNGAALGAILLAMSTRQSLAQAMVYCLGCAAGLTVAMLLVHSGRERLEFSAVPRAFTGLPITLVYIGLLSLAIYGLIGHQLPT